MLTSPEQSVIAPNVPRDTRWAFYSSSNNRISCNGKFIFEVFIEVAELWKRNPDESLITASRVLYMVIVGYPLAINVEESTLKDDTLPAKRYRMRAPALV